MYVLARRYQLKTPITLGLLSILALAPTPASAERACRPSLSNMYHCPDTSKPEPRSTKRAPPTNTSERPCRPSLSNLWKCPDTGTSTESYRREKPKRTTTAPERRSRPSETTRTSRAPERGLNQYSTERRAWSHCPTDTVVWANTRSGIYHFRGTHHYGGTVTGAYMCEQDAIAEGMRAARNEARPSG